MMTTGSILRPTYDVEMIIMRHHILFRSVLSVGSEEAMITIHIQMNVACIDLSTYNSGR